MSIISGRSNSIRYLIITYKDVLIPLMYQVVIKTIIPFNE